MSDPIDIAEGYSAEPYGDGYIICHSGGGRAVAQLHMAAAVRGITRLRAALAAQVPQPVAWMDPENPRDPIGAEKKRDMETINGAPGRTLAAKYTIPLIPAAPGASPPAAPPTDTVEALAHRIAWRYKKSSDPNHSDTYTFNRATLLQFAAALAPPPAALAVPDDVKDALRYRTMLANMVSLELRTDKGSTLNLNAKHRGEAHTRKGTDAVLDGLAAASPQESATTRGGGEPTPGPC